MRKMLLLVTITLAGCATHQTAFSNARVGLVSTTTNPVTQAQSTTITLK